MAAILNFQVTWSSYCNFILEGIRIYNWTRVWPPRGLMGRTKLDQIVLNLLTTFPLKLLVRFKKKDCHNDHLVVGIRNLLEKGLTPRGLSGETKSPKSSWDFSETNDQILMKLDHNDHLVLWIRIMLVKGLTTQGAEEHGQIVLNLNNNFSSETTGQILKKLGHNDLLVVRIRIFTWKGSDPPGSCMRGGVK